MTEREQALERRVHQLEEENVAIRRYFERPEYSLVQNYTRWWLGLDEYELVNVREALRAIMHWQAGPSPLDVLHSGDWVGQLLMKLESVQSLTQPNRTAAQYREQARTGASG